MKKDSLSKIKPNLIVGRHKFYAFEDLLNENLKSKKFRVTYEAAVETRRKLQKQLREAREAKGLTQKQVAIKAEMPQSVVARIECGDRDMSVRSFQRVAHAVGKRLELV